MDLNVIRWLVWLLSLSLIRFSYNNWTKSCLVAALTPCDAHWCLVNQHWIRGPTCYLVLDVLTLLVAQFASPLVLHCHSTHSLNLVEHLHSIHCPQHCVNVPTAALHLQPASAESGTITWVGTWIWTFWGLAVLFVTSETASFGKRWF